MGGGSGNVLYVLYECSAHSWKTVRFLTGNWRKVPAPWLPECSQRKLQEPRSIVDSQTLTMTLIIS